MTLTQDDFEQGYRLGYGTGYDHGWRQGVVAEQDAWDRIFHTPYRDDWRQPSRAELEERRRPVPRPVNFDPCADKCGICPTCVCSQDYWRLRRAGRIAWDHANDCPVDNYRGA